MDIKLYLIALFHKGLSVVNMNHSNLTAVNVHTVFGENAIVIVISDHAGKFSRSLQGCKANALQTDIRLLPLIQTTG